MVNAKIEKALVERLSRLAPADQEQVLKFAQALVESSRTRHSRTILDLIGSMASADADEMTSAIEDGCERVDPSDW